jgi:polyphenol oxidase
MRRTSVWQPATPRVAGAGDRMSIQWLQPQWPAPQGVRALSTLRAGGHSQPPYAGLNLAAHVGDDPTCVQRNRRALQLQAGLPAEPLWLHQVHGVDIVAAGTVQPTPTADGCVAHASGQVCVVLTADCLPVLFCDRAGTCVAAAHAGWRGLVSGILEATVRSLQRPADQLLVWLGPAIGPQSFEVGAEVRDQFLARDPNCTNAFVPNDRQRWQADLYQLARQELASLGLRNVYGGSFDCSADAERFFSYRRDGRTGRMATMIWIENR